MAKGNTAKKGRQQGASSAGMRLVPTPRAHVSRAALLVFFAALLLSIGLSSALFWTSGGLTRMTLGSTGNLSVTGNISTSNYGLFGFVGSVANRVTMLFVTDINMSGNLVSTGNITLTQSGSAITFPDATTQNTSASSKASPGTCSGARNVSQNTTSSGVQCQTVPGTLLNVQILKSGTVYTPTAGTKSFMIELWGGGAAGGSCTAVAGCACGGGGSGGYAKDYIASVTQTTYNYTIGAGGAAVAGAAGGSGGNTSFAINSSTNVTAYGGTGGQFKAGTLAMKFTAGGAGGIISTNGDVNGAGVPGGTGTTFATVAIGAASGFGASTSLGGGGIGVFYTTAAAVPGIAAVANTGSGGSGGATGTTTVAAGGAGAAGVIYVWEYS